MVHSFPTRRSSDLLPSRRWRNWRTVPSPSPAFASGRRARSEEHTSELQSHHPNSYAVFCLNKKNRIFSCGSAARTDAAAGSTEIRRLAFFFNDTATTEIYTGWYTLSLHDALPI